MPRANPAIGTPSIVKRMGRALAMATVLGAALPGCMAHASGEIVYEYPTEYVVTVPARIELYPRTHYHGHTVYLVDGRWYYRPRDRWLVFRQEPLELREYRSRHAAVFVAPPAHHHHHHSHAPARPRTTHRDRWQEERRAKEHRAKERREAERRHEHHAAARQRAEHERRVAHARAHRPRPSDRDRRDRARERERRRAHDD